MDRLVSVVRVEGMDKKEKNEYYKNMRNAFDIKSEKWFAREDGIKEGEARGLAKGLAEGEAKGRAEGKAEGKAEVAKELKVLGIHPEQIAKATGLSLETIARL